MGLANPLLRSNTSKQWTNSAFGPQERETVQIEQMPAQFGLGRPAQAPKRTDGQSRDIRDRLRSRLRAIACLKRFFSPGFI